MTEGRKEGRKGEKEWRRRGRLEDEALVVVVGFFVAELATQPGEMQGKQLHSSPAIC